MAKFQVLCRVDAWIDYVTEIEAQDAEEAAWLAKEGPPVKWDRDGEVEFDTRAYFALDDTGEPIEGTRAGDL